MPRTTLLLLRASCLAALLALGCSSEPQSHGAPGGSGGDGAGIAGGGEGAGGAGGQGAGGQGTGGQPADGDGDGYTDDDCDDDDPDVHPGATEVCDGKDTDCDGTVDGPNAVGAVPFYLDGDGDGWGLDGVSELACALPPGFAAQGSDCDDGDPTVFPGAPELCDLQDNDCDGVIDFTDPPIVNPPWGAYYDTVDVTTGASMRATVHEVIDDHQYFPYSSTWVILEQADEDPNDPTRILDVYRNASYAKAGGGNTDYGREHSWPQSYFPSNSSTYPVTDCHHLFLADTAYNTSRGNLPFDTCTASCEERPTLLNNAQGGGTGVYPGNSNWRRNDTWEVWNGRRGDIARALFYLDVRYEGGLHGVTGHLEPNLVLTDDRNLIASSGASDPMAYMGLLSTLARWHCEDPVSAEEAARHEVIVGFQGNRNPFIDHPEWVYCVYLDQCL